MTTRKRSQFTVRQLQSDAELAACASLDHSSLTEFVWQVDMREEGDEMALRLRTVRLPRSMQIDYPRDRASLLTSWERRDCFLVAAADDVILGYINLRRDTVPARGWIHDLVVSRPFRRRRIGSALLEQAGRWAALHEIAHLTFEVQTKNYPGIQFTKAKGYVFCGFNEHYYANQDIAVFFGKNV